MKNFRRRVLRPAEGVFLFHPRALERLIRRHVGGDSRNLAISALRYYLMPRTVLLNGLEDENPDALAIIEGLNLPDWVILLPMPSAQELAADPPNAGSGDTGDAGSKPRWRGPGGWLATIIRITIRLAPEDWSA